MAMRGSSAATSSGLSSLRPACDQLSLAFHDVLCEWLASLPDDWREVPLLVPPLPTAIVASPRRALTYSAVALSLTPKKTWVTLESSVCSWPSGQHFLSCP